MNKTKKGFTLIELLVVIAIIAILAVAVILTLNPAELLRQSRDSTRLSDIATLKSAISLYLADVSLPNLDARTGAPLTCYQSLTTATSSCTTWFPSSAAVSSSPATGGNAINGTGWLPVNFTKISSGAPIGNLPIDPTNSGAYFYSYISSSTSLTFKLATHMESNKYGVGGGATDVGANDGGSANGATFGTDYYEAGTNLSL